MTRFFLVVTHDEKEVRIKWANRPEMTISRSGCGHANANRSLLVKDVGAIPVCSKCKQKLTGSPS